MKVRDIPGIPPAIQWRKHDVGSTSPFGEDQVEIASTAAAPPATSRSTGWRVGLALALALGLGGCVGGIAWSAPPDPPATQVVAQAQQDYGPAQDVKAVKQVIRQQVGQAGNVSVSHDWALGRGFTEHTAASVLLHRVDGKWQVKDQDGGVYVDSILQEHGVPKADIPNLLRVYQ